MSRLGVRAMDLEVDRPPGGRGPQALYAIEITIDGRAALLLQSWQFKVPGQMHAFLEIMQQTFCEAHAKRKGGVA